MCKVLDVSRSGYYAWRRRPESERTKRRKRITKRIHQIVVKSRRLYGSPKITQIQRREDGERVSQKMVANIMRENELRSRTVRKYKATTDSNHNYPVHGNVLNQTFVAQRLNQVYMADITYIPTDEGWVYLASLMDLYSRKIVGWHVDARMTKELCITALEQAFKRQSPVGSVLHHSDRGSQYASHDDQNKLQEYEMVGSMSRKGNCFDNACIESFHSIIKRGLVDLEKFKTRQQAVQRIFEYIEVWYNRERVHSSIGFVSPAEYERRYFHAQQVKVS